MATIAVFEDNSETVNLLREIISNTEHTIVGEADSTPAAHALLGGMAIREVQADITLVDGNLSLNNPYDYPYPAFNFVPPGHELPVAAPKKWYQRTEKQIINPAEVAVIHEGKGIGTDGRFILRVLQACEIKTTTVNLSSDSKGAWDTDQLLDYEMSKHGLRNLLDIIMQVEASKNIT